MVDDGRIPFTVAAPFYRVCSDKPQRLGFRDPNGISHRPRAVHYRTHPVTVRVSGLGETGFKSMSSSGLSFPSHGHLVPQVTVCDDSTIYSELSLLHSELGVEIRILLFEL